MPRPRTKLHIVQVGAGVEPFAYYIALDTMCGRNTHAVDRTISSLQVERELNRICIRRWCERCMTRYKRTRDA